MSTILAEKDGFILRKGQDCLAGWSIKGLFVDSVVEGFN